MPKSMTAKNYYDALKHQLDAVGQRLNTKVRAFRVRAESPANHEAISDRYMKRRAAIEQKITAELKTTKGVSFALLKAEFERDLNGIMGQLLAWQERLDGPASRESRHDSQ